MGGSSIPIPPQSYVNAADTLYLQPRDFAGTYHRRVEPRPGQRGYPVRSVPDGSQLVRCPDRAGQRGAQGIQAAIADLENPDNYQITSLLDNPTLAPLVDAAYTSGLIDTLQPTSEQLTEGAARRQFPGFRRDLALAAGRYRQRHQQHAFS